MKQLFGSVNQRRIQMNHSSKSRILEALKSNLRFAEILDSVIVTFDFWSSNRLEIIENIILSLNGNEIFAVRSSAVDEDGEISSNAGHYKSLLNVDKSRLAESIDEVFNSYGNIPPHSEVFVQPMLRNVLSSGVVFSHDPNTFSPYIVINMSHGTSTDSVTSGMGGEVWYHHINSPIKPSLEIQPIVDMVIELLKIFEGNPIDCEFAFIEDSDKILPILLQVRPLILLESPVDIYTHTNWLNTIYEKIKLGMEPHPFLLGKKNIFSVMSDWNPAEIIGIRPKPLALSIYRELITDSTWAYQRHNYGYRNLRSFHLLQSFHGLPYVDVRLSFNSFIPASLDVSIANRLADFYIKNYLIFQVCTIKSNLISFIRAIHLICLIEFKSYQTMAFHQII